LCAFRSVSGSNFGIWVEIPKHVSNDRLIWEAPTKKQQAWMVNTFGTNVNLGNIQPNDVISLEALRSGLRGDTFLTFLPEVPLDGYFSAHTPEAFGYCSEDLARR
jgi:phosphosulfolactate synthase